MDGGPWQATVHGVAKSQTRLSDFTSTPHWGFLGGSVVKNPPANVEMRVQSLGQEDPLENEMATYASIIV